MTSAIAFQHVRGAKLHGLSYIALQTHSHALVDTHNFAPDMSTHIDSTDFLVDYRYAKILLTSIYI